MSNEETCGEQCALDRQKEIISDSKRATEIMKQLGGNELAFNPYKDSIIRLEGFISGNVSYRHAVDYSVSQQDRIKRLKDRKKVVNPKDAELETLRQKVKMYESVNTEKS